jgi:hypothetical protein
MKETVVFEDEALAEGVAETVLLGELSPTEL